VDNSFYSKSACGKSCGKRICDNIKDKVIHSLWKTHASRRLVEKNALWQKVLDEMKASVEKTRFSTWLKNTELTEIKDGTAYIGVTNAYSKELINAQYKGEIIKVLQEEDPTVRNLAFKIKKNILLEQLPIEIEPRQTQKPKADSPVGSCNLRKEYTFDTFIVGNNNSLAYAVAKEVATNPGVRHNPLFIYGGVGLGKTHLAQAIGNEHHLSNPKTKIVYVSCETFTNDFINAIATKKMNEFKRNYREVDILIVDDVQFLSSKEGSQEEFFHTFNSLQQRSRQIILTADKIPKAIPALEGRLASRFGGGMVVDVQPPNLETRMAILTGKCRDKAFTLPENVIEYVARNIPSNIRELEGALNRLMTHCQYNHITPSVQVATEVLKDMISSSNHIVDSAEIISAVCKHFGITKEEILGKGRQKELALPRQITIFLIRENTNKSLPEVGKIMGGKDHTTILYSEKKVRDLLGTDVDIKSEIEKIRHGLFSTLSLNNN